MKDLSFFLLKNALGAKMKKGFRNSCNGDDSTSTVNNQQRTEQGSTCTGARSMVSSSPLRGSQPTLEEMILQLELEEKAARRAKLDDSYGEIRHRMSCVNSSDILRSARNALNQYPRFSLDGKDAMYRSSFRNTMNNNPGLRKEFRNKNSDLDVSWRIRQLPATLGGENVVWCRPGVVGKLMGLEAMPIPVGRYHRSLDKSGLSAAIKKQHLRSRGGPRIPTLWNDLVGKEEGGRGSCSTAGYYVMKPIKVDHRCSNEEVGWPMHRFQ